MTDSYAARIRAEQSLAQVDRRLAMVEAAGLRPEQMRTYDQALAIQRRAQAAMQENDYAAAQALGNKAGRLVAALKQR